MARLGYIQVSRRCNQQCRFCSNPPMEVDLAERQGRKLVDDLVNRGYDGVIFTGGEPTLSPLLPAFIRYALSRNIEPRIVTNGRLIGEAGGLLDELVESGLKHIHLSIYSHKPDIVADLTGKEDSLDMALKALDRIGRRPGGVAVDINIVINHYNADHLDRLAAFLVERRPFIHHFVFNNLDPFMNRVAQNPDTIPGLWEFELSLFRALRFLEQAGKTFRIERVPLCYMVEFAHVSTETRKIVKGEDRVTHFLDDKGTVHQTSFAHDKAGCCSLCSLDRICAGLDGVGEGYSLDELHPVFVDPLPIIGKILKRRG
ncbi:MAG: radical SAM protein [Pseudomonadota bacterium]